LVVRAEHATSEGAPWLESRDQPRHVDPVGRLAVETDLREETLQRVGERGERQLGPHARALAKRRDGALALPREAREVPRAQVVQRDGGLDEREGERA